MLRRGSQGWYKYVLSLLFITIFFTRSYCQAKFYAASSAKKIGKSEYVQVQFTVENAAAVEHITPPAFKNFSIVSGPNQQSGMSIINGNMLQSISLGYVLKPLSTGRLVIGAAITKADGKELRTLPLTIEVSNSSSTNSGPNSLSPFGNMRQEYTEPANPLYNDYILGRTENVEEKIKKNIFVRIDVNKNTCYVGQPIVATYKLYTRLKSESNVTKTPSFNGFSVSELEMPDNYSLTTEKYNGREYNVYTLRKVQLYPLQTGILNLEPVEVENRINFLKGEYAAGKKGNVLYDLLREFANETVPGMATDQRTVTLFSRPQSINVKPLPEAGKTETFKSAVGKFEINASLQNNTISTDDAGSLKIIISGEGNIEMINAPEIIWQQGIEGFEPKSTENIDKLSVPMHGEKTFVYPFTVEREGEHIIPALEFTYFDPALQVYKTIKTQPLALTVIKGKGNRNILNSSDAKIEKNNDTFYSYRWYILTGVLLLTGFLIFLMKKRKQKNSAKTLVKKGDQHTNKNPQFVIPSNPLLAAETLLIENKPREFYKELDACLKKYLSAKLTVPAEELSKKKINERMDKCNVSINTAIIVNSILEDIELNLYAMASSITEMEAIYSKANEAVALLDKQVC